MIGLHNFLPGTPSIEPLLLYNRYHHYHSIDDGGGGSRKHNNYFGDNFMSYEQPRIGAILPTATRDTVSDFSSRKHYFFDGSGRAWYGAQSGRNYGCKSCLFTM
jgi:hypothetical protein